MGQSVTVSICPNLHIMQISYMNNIFSRSTFLCKIQIIFNGAFTQTIFEDMSEPFPLKYIMLIISEFMQ